MALLDFGVGGGNLSQRVPGNRAWCPRTVGEIFHASRQQHMAAAARPQLWEAHSSPVPRGLSVGLGCLCPAGAHGTAGQQGLQSLPPLCAAEDQLLRWQQEQQWPHSMLMSSGCHHQISVHSSQAWGAKPPDRCGGRCPPYAQLACLPQASLESEATAWKLSVPLAQRLGNALCWLPRAPGRKYPVRFHPALKSHRRMWMGALPYHHS